MSYTDLDTDHTDQPTQYTMQFADPDWQPDHRPHVKLDITDEGGRLAASRVLSSPAELGGEITFAVHRPEPAADPDVNTQVEVPELLYSVYDTESSKWVDVPFHVAWLFYSLFMFMGQLLVFGFSTLVLHWPLGVYVMWGILNLLALPFLSYWWTKHERDRHYRRTELRTR